MEITSLMSAMVYGPDGAMFGKFDEITVPEIKNKVQENKPTDAIGTRRMPSISLDPMEATFKAVGFNAKFHAMASNPFRNDIGLQIRSNLLSAKGKGQVVGKPASLELRGWFSSPKVGSFKQGEGAQCEYKMEVHAIKLIVDGKTLTEIDIDNYIWRVNGEDLLKDFRANLGIS
jgi:P2 family phage contractile tail tube protein